MKLELRSASLWALLFAAVHTLPAQCGTQWLPGGGFSGVYGRVRTVTSWDPDGPGPETARLVAGGDFTFAGNVAANNVVAFDPASETWSRLGAGTNGSVRSLLALPNGDLIAGGEFTEAGGEACSRVARWNGTAWEPLGLGVTDGGYTPSIRCLAALPNGDLVIGGSDFTEVGGATCYRVARWDGATWHPMDSGMNDVVNALAVMSNGDLVAGGQFTTAGGVACSRLARWDGATWSPIGSGIGSFGSLHVDSLCTMPNGDLVIGGNFSSAGGVAATAAGGHGAVPAGGCRVGDVRAAGGGW